MERIVYPKMEDRSIPTGATCQETYGWIEATDTYLRCGKPAVAIIKLKDPNPYYMCRLCGNHNARNRGGVVVFATEEVI